MKTLKGPALFLAQFAGDAAPFDTLPAIARWAASCGFEGVQIPTWDKRLFDLARAAESDAYCDEVRGTLADAGLALTELSTHLQGQLVAVHPAYDDLADGFADPSVRAAPAARQAWAVEQLHLAARASRRLGLAAHATFSGALAWPFLYPFPQRPPGLVDDAFDELARRWHPILNAFDAAGCDVCFELHPGEDLHDGVTFERLLERVGGHPRCNILYDPSHLVLQCMDYAASSTSITSGSAPFMRRTPNFGRVRGPASMGDTRTGSTGPAGSDRSAMARSTSRPSSRSSRNTISTVGRCSSGNAA